jgi:sugar phosphate isomerase/epimerase
MKNEARRKFLKGLVIAPALVSGPLAFGNTSAVGFSPLKPSLNAYSFNEALIEKKMSLDQLLEFCQVEGIGALDITAYYFLSYPVVPPDEVLFQFKRKAHQLGVDISGTGVRNDFTEPDAAKLKEQIQLVKNWIEAAAKIGAPVIRIFAGNRKPVGQEHADTLQWMVAAIQECVEYGKKYGIIVALQNHNDFIETADQALEIIKLVNSNWFGLVLDTGSYRIGDPYSEIAKTAMHAVNWQVKENIFIDGKEVEADVARLIKIIADSGYKGYIPIETLGAGDPKPKIIKMMVKVRKALEMGRG